MKSNNQSIHNKDNHEEGHSTDSENAYIIHPINLKSSMKQFS